MKYPWIDEYLMAKRAVTKDLQPEWNWIRYKIGDRMFAAILLDDDDRPVYINLKLEPTEGEFLRRQYADIIPGYYSDKRCWNRGNSARRWRGSRENWRIYMEPTGLWTEQEDE